MKKILFVSLVLAAVFTGLAVGPAFVDYNGYILVVMEDGTLQMSIFGFLIVSLATVLFAWFAFIVIRHLIRALGNYSQWWANLSTNRRKQAFTNGILALAEGEYIVAKNHLSKIKDQDFDGINILAMAEIAFHTDEQTTALEYLDQAMAHPKSRVAATVRAVQHYLAQNQSAVALQLIESSDSTTQKAPSVIKHWAKALQQAKRWSELKTKVDQWKKPLGNEFGYWKQQASSGQFAETASKHGALQLQTEWKALPRASRKDVHQQSAYIQQLLLQGMHQDAERLLLESQKSQPNQQLLGLMGELKLQNASATIKRLEGWIKADEHNASLYSTLGKVAYASGDQILAEKALTRAVHLANDTHDILLLAQIKEAQNEVDQALSLYKKVCP